MKTKLFFRNIEDNICYELEDILSELKQEDYDKTEIYEAVRDKDCGAKWCNAIGQLIVKGESECGKNCSYYTPKNGKNGCCEKLRLCYVSGQKYILHKNGKLQLVK